MGSHQWLKFWPQDWQRDPALRICTLAARGLWIELLSLAHDAKPYGHILVNGRQPNNKQMAAVAGCTEAEVAALLAELEEAGVFSKTPDGTIYSRRMVRDAESSQAGRSAAGKRWGAGRAET
jgi:hypothetical protein